MHPHAGHSARANLSCFTCLMIFITSPVYVPRSHLCAMYGTSSPAQLGTPTIFWNGRLDSNQRPRVFNRISLHAIKLCRLSYARICSACRLDCHASCALEAPQAFQAATHWLSQGGRIPAAVFSGHCHLHVSHAGRSHIVRALPGLWYHTSLRLFISHALFLRINCPPLSG